MTEYFAGGHLRFVDGEWRDDDGNMIEISTVRHGRWEEWDDGFGGTYYRCSVCGEDWCTIDGTPAENSMRYCPQCGARMDGDADD